MNREFFIESLEEIMQATLGISMARALDTEEGAYVHGARINGEAAHLSPNVMASALIQLANEVMMDSGNDVGDELLDECDFVDESEDEDGE